MDLFILLTAVILNIFLGIVVLLRNRRSATNKLFFLLTFDIVLWSISNYISLHSTSDVTLLFWMRLVMMFAVPQAVCFFLLIHTLPSSKLQIQTKWLLIVVGLTLFTMAVAMSNFLFTGLNLSGSIPTPIPGPGMFLFLLLTVGSLILGTITLIRKMISAKGVMKTQYKFVFMGLVSMFLLIVTLNFATVILFNNLQFIAFSPLFTLPFILSIAYTIIRHKFLDISYLVTRAFIYLVLITIVAVLFSSFIFIVSQFFFDIPLTLSQQGTLIGITIIITLSFQSIQRFITRTTDSLLYRVTYNSDDLLTKLNKIMTTTLELEKMGKELLLIIIKDVKIIKAVIVIQEPNTPISISAGTNTNNDISSSFLSLFDNMQSYLSFEEVNEGEIKEEMRKREFSVVIPLNTENKNVGLLFLGEKLSGDGYSERDFRFLDILAPELSIALQNAQAYEEIKRFNITLQEEVEKATKELKEANNQLQELDKLKDEFVSLASHELRTPMAAIKGSLSTILEGYAGPISNDSKEFLSAAYNENDRLIRLVNNLLNTSRIESGRLSFTISPVDLTTLIQDVVKNMQMQVKEKNIFLRHESTGSIPLVTADEDKIKEVVINLIGNAIKFTSQGGITIKTEVQEDMVLTSVADTGTGIHKEDFDLLFKKFSQVKRDQKYTKSYGGTGLGLYLSQKIVEGLGGKIWLDSEVGKGTTFFFTLPISK